MEFSRLKDLRKDKDKTQPEIAELLGVCELTYRRYEKGIKDITLKDACILSDYYGVSLDYLAGRTNDPARQTRQTRADEAELLNKYSSLSPKAKEAVNNVINVYSEQSQIIINNK